MIQQVSIRNFKCLRDVTIDLEPFTVFVGANGSGKTSVLQAIDLLCRTFRTQPGKFYNEYKSNRAYGTSDEVEMMCKVGRALYRFSTRNSGSKAFTQESGNTEDGFNEENTLELLNYFKPWQHGSGETPASLWLKLDPAVLRQIQPGQDIRAMGDGGQGMHRALSSMMLERREDFFQVEADLRRIVNSVKQLQPTAEHEIRFDTINGKGLTASQVSEGTLLTLGLLTAIHGENKPGILLLDDLDRALHPKAQRELIELLRGVQSTNPEIQIVATTHSPYMLDCMEPEEVRMTSLKEDGSTACDALTHHPKFEKWKDEFDPGEMWSFFGEKWVAEGEVVAK